MLLKFDRKVLDIKIFEGEYGNNNFPTEYLTITLRDCLDTNRNSIDEYIYYSILDDDGEKPIYNSFINEDTLPPVKSLSLELLLAVYIHLLKPALAVPVPDYVEGALIAERPELLRVEGVSILYSNRNVKLGYKFLIKKVTQLLRKTKIQKMHPKSRETSLEEFF